jgi:hypothetical protein
VSRLLELDGGAALPVLLVSDGVPRRTASPRACRRRPSGALPVSRLPSLLSVTGALVCGFDRGGRMSAENECTAEADEGIRWKG